MHFLPSTTIARVVSVIIVCLVVLIIAGFALWLNFDRSLNFLAYQPGLLPKGVTVTGHKVTIAQGEDGKYTKSIGYSSDIKDFHIGEYKSNLQDYHMSLFTCAYHPIDSVCEQYTSPAHQAYIILTIHYSASNHNGTEQYVSWLKGDTLIWIDLNHDQAEKYSPQTWGKVIDTFTPVHYNHENIQHESWHGV